MPRQRAYYSRRTYAFPEDFPERLKRFKEEPGLSWSELNRRLGTHPPNREALEEGPGPRQHAAHDGAAGPVRRPGAGPPVYRMAVVRAKSSAATWNSSATTKRRVCRSCTMIEEEKSLLITYLADAGGIDADGDLEK